ncbi:MAG TPA: M6 family metalloprotease domain-containing protein [Methylococcaceae bacterium]|nr:M6 family metalloprotease domain-containing protein [Methylococcaceae bacterium]HIA45227.1 M6 family metalloprotease domain-containing protein [Methylococcaceae bacterium]HIB61638.1 M6 family metalloprotease domain-containing protein [Methylococcaceae bacterium]HIN67732.1 M6 family metalloprotease domain-containing protein [Methylococcales bacterium]HIO45548.1 M6 family metalloprotease domain-containing protein [Methylococcales bacterium]
MTTLIKKTPTFKKTVGIAGYLLIGIISLFLLTYMKTTYAINASPHPINATQPDGTQIVLRVKGDERFHWQEDANGYTVLRDQGRYVYATRGSSGHLVPSDLEVGKASPKAHGLQKRILPSKAIINQQRASGPAGSSSEGSSGPEQVPPSGDIKNLVVMVRFSDHANRPLPSTADMDVLFNADTPDLKLAPTGSVKAVYLENSYNQMTLNSTISGWITVSNTEAYYADGASGTSKLWEALREALTILDPSVDFNEFDSDNDGFIDAITFIHSGYGAEWDANPDHIWSHRWAIQPAWTSAENVRVFDYHISPGLWGLSGSDIGRIGVIAHETGHFFGLPDLYDTNDGGAGIGSYGMMANSWGFDGSQHYPPHFSPWSKINLGWVIPTLLNAAGTYDLQHAEEIGAVYRVDNGYPNDEYLLIENRQPVGFDARMPQGGLAIWHIDDTADYNTQGYPGQPNWPNNGYHYRVALLQADGNYNLEKGHNRGDSDDVWHAGGVHEINETTVPDTDAYQDGIVTSTGNRISNISVAGLSMSFVFDDGVVHVDTPSAPELTGAVYDGVSNVDLVWLDQSDNEDSFIIFRDDIEIDSIAANNTTYQDVNVPAGSYDYIVQAFNSGGSADSDPLSVEVVLPPIAYASGESTTFGTVAGDYRDTHDNLNSEILFEVESGGKPSKRTSRLEHIWQFDNVGPGLVTSLTVFATGTNNSEADNFTFSYSVDSGSNYTQAFTLTADGVGHSMTAELSNVSNTVLVKVEDTNRDRGNRSLDSVSIQKMFINWTDEVVFTAPSNLIATAVSDTQIDLSWTDGTGESTYTVRNVSEPITDVKTDIPPNTTTTSISELAASTTYSYEVCGVSVLSILECSNEAAASTFSEPAEADITLTVSTYKVKGVNHADLSVTGVTSYNVFVYDEQIALNVIGVYTDNTGQKGGMSRSYKACDSNDDNVCSDVVTVTW